MSLDEVSLKRLDTQLKETLEIALAGIPEIFENDKSPDCSTDIPITSEKVRIAAELLFSKGVPDFLRIDERGQSMSRNAISVTIGTFFIDREEPNGMWCVRFRPPGATSQYTLSMRDQRGDVVDDMVNRLRNAADSLENSK